MRLTALILVLATLALPVWPDEITSFVTEVETLRGQSFVRPVEHRVLPRAELRSFLEKQIETELPVGIDAYLATLEALHLVDSSASVDSMLDLFDAQVLAFYDPVGHVYYSIDEPPADVVLPPVMVDAVIVHELVHALQDQRFDAGRRTLEIQSNWDAALAYQSVLEGEALLVMMGYLGESMGLELDDLVQQEAMIDAVRESAAAGTNVPEGVSPYFVESLKFPYVEGLAFVVDLYRRDGWSAIDAMHANPPLSTEELTHPDVYRERVRQGQKPGDPLRSKPTDSLIETVLGEFHWTFLLGREAGEGWASDLVSVRLGKDGPTVLIDSTWDAEIDAEEFEAAYRELLDRLDAKNRVVSRTGKRVKVAYGADSRGTRVFAGSAEEEKPPAD